MKLPNYATQICCFGFLICFLAVELFYFPLFAFSYLLVVLFIGVFCNFSLCAEVSPFILLVVFLIGVFCYSVSCCFFVVSLRTVGYVYDSKQLWLHLPLLRYVAVMCVFRYYGYVMEVIVLHIKIKSLVESSATN
jgi:hypothetical protein